MNNNTYSMSEEESTYLGQKGYTIYKECLSVGDQKWIRDTLTVAPYIPKSPVQPPSFPIYKEGQSKLYLPRYFGIENFGTPDVSKIADGDDINVPFKGTLRDYQKPIVKAYMDAVKSPAGGGGLLDVPCGWGKTLMALWIITLLKKKTLVIVHKSFLLNQWEERIKEFLPTAKIGRIQGPIMDIEGADIVIGMLQSLSMKSYPESTWKCFGLMIVDECHHISSEVFSRALVTIVTKYTLGLSATMKRKDGLTDVFKMFLGDIVYSVERKKEDNVLIKGIVYRSNDPEFEETELDYRGNPKYSTMVSKICSYNDRTEFILKVIEKELADYDEEQQIMILAQQKSILVYIHDAIKHRRIATVGYYVGGMKEEDLKASEDKTVICATYQMAAEGLDIKSLSSLILATPRTDITQAVGRILRVKRERPLVVDIVDTHDVFRRQYSKRKTFYRKNKYTVMESDNTRYFKDEWDEVKSRSKGKKKKKEIDDVADELSGKCLISI